MERFLPIEAGETKAIELVFDAHVGMQMAADVEVAGLNDGFVAEDEGTEGDRLYLIGEIEPIEVLNEGAIVVSNDELHTHGGSVYKGVPLCDYLLRKTQR